MEYCCGTSWKFIRLAFAFGILIAWGFGFSTWRTIPFLLSLFFIAFLIIFAFVRLPIFRLWVFINGQFPQAYAFIAVTVLIVSWKGIMQSEDGQVWLFCVCWVCFWVRLGFLLWSRSDLCINAWCLIRWHWGTISYFSVNVFWTLRGFRFLPCVRFSLLVASLKLVHAHPPLTWSKSVQDFVHVRSSDHASRHYHFWRENCWQSNFFWTGQVCFTWWWFFRQDCGGVSLIEKVQCEIHFGDIFILLT